MNRQGKVLFAHVRSDRHAAETDAGDYRNDSRNRGAWSVRIHPRTVRANSVELPVWVVIVREKTS